MTDADILPEGDPPQVGPLWQPLLETPCRACGSRRLFPAGMAQGGVATGMPVQTGAPPDGAGATFTLTVLCGDCGDVHERRGWQAET